MASYEYSLPVEQWRQVLVNNSPVDLCNVVLVSRHMNSVASLPELWAGTKVNRRKVKENGLAEFYNINRFKEVKEIDFRRFGKLECRELERLLKEIHGSPLKSANFGQNFRGVSAELLASAVSHLHIANLGGTILTTDQCIELLNASLSSTTLKNLDLVYVNLSKVPAELLANSISRLQQVILGGTHLTTDQCAALLKASLSSETLKNVSLKGVNLSEVPVQLLANSISRLQEVNLSGTKLTTDQRIALLKASLSSTTLRNVNLEGVNLSEVPAELLADSISRLKEVKLQETHLTTDQCVALLKASLSSSLTNLNLVYVNLSKVPAELLANSISRLHEVILGTYPGGTHVTTDQCVALLKASISSTTLTNVNLKGINLCEVPAELLANSICRLQKVNLLETHLTTDQCVALLKASISSSLTNLNLNFVDLSEVPAELLANSISRLHEVDLCRTDLTTDQCVALLKASHSSTTLHCIDLSRNEITKKLPSDKQYLLTTSSHLSSKQL